LIGLLTALSEFVAQFVAISLTFLTLFFVLRGQAQGMLLNPVPVGFHVRHVFVNSALFRFQRDDSSAGLSMLCLELGRATAGRTDLFFERGSKDGTILIELAPYFVQSAKGPSCMASFRSEFFDCRTRALNPTGKRGCKRGGAGGDYVVTEVRSKEFRDLGFGLARALRPMNTNLHGDLFRDCPPIRQ
jgi:hypothetical protein